MTFIRKIKDFMVIPFTYIATSINNDIMFQLLLAVIIIDVLTGISRAAKERKLNSTVGINGLIRHGLVIIIMGVVHYFSHAMDAGWFAYAFALAFILEYVISIAENWALSGYKVPESITKLLDKLPQPNFKSLDVHDKNNANKVKEIKKTFTNNNDKGVDNNG